ncbi:hypothetical protein MMC17_002716 [Xylographa soralifera]|nr:hypothetical protein [Xylographa soralifera]
MPTDLSTTLPRKVTVDVHPNSDSNSKPPHLRVLEREEHTIRAPIPAKLERQVCVYPPLSEQIAIQERAEKETIAQNGIECPVCQEDFHHGEAVIRVEGCRHTFHTTECFQPWFESKAETCPYCRGTLARLTPGIWQRGEGVVPGDFYLSQVPSGQYVRAWNGNHPELWELSPVYYEWSGQRHATVKHRYEDVCDLIWDVPLGTYQELFGIVEAGLDDFGMEDLHLEELFSEEVEEGQLLVERVLPELGETIQAARRQLEALRVSLLGLSPEQGAEAEPIYQLLFQNLNSYLDLLVSSHQVI